MPARRYYSQRKNHDAVKIDLINLRAIFLSIYSDFERRGYFQEYLGINCVDAFFPGKAGEDVGDYFLRKIRNKSLWPISLNYFDYSEEELFDVIEFLFDHVSRPISGGESFGHSNCGVHYSNFEKNTGEEDFVAEINEFLNDYGDGFELSRKGEVLSLSGEFEPILKAELPNYDPENVENKVREAVDKYRKYGSSIDQRKEAVVGLCNVLEFLRPKLAGVITDKDENDLFNIANNFGLRHHNDVQKTNYNKSIWLSWMFYFYLSTIHSVIRLLKKK